MEDKVKILKELEIAIKQTRAGDDLNKLVYDKENEQVYGYFGEQTEPARTINVHLDSGWAMIKDVVNHLDIG